MIEDYWFPWYPARFKADTMDLDPFQDGVYRRLIDHYMETKIGLPDSDGALARIAGIGVDEFVDKCGIIKAKFKLDPKTGRLMHKKCDAVLKDQNARSVLASKKAKKAADARWQKDKENQGSLFNGDASSNASGILGDATGQDMTGHDMKGKDSDSSLIPSKNLKTPNNGEGVFKDSGGQGGASRPAGRPYRIEHHLNDEARKLAKMKAPGWDIYHLFSIYDEGIASGKRQIPDKPNFAFPAWCAKYSKGKPPA